MDVSPKPRIVGQIPAIVIGIFVDDDRIGIPKPIAAVADVDRRHAEVEAIEPESRRTSAG